MRLLDLKKKLSKVTATGKLIDWDVDGGKLTITIDPNKDGEPVAGFFLDLSEVPDEILSAFK